MERTVQIDLSGVQASRELHELLARSIGFPDYYGRNWDAFNECIADPEIDLPDRIRLTGLGALTEALPREAALLKRCLAYPEVRPVVEWLT